MLFARALGKCVPGARDPTLPETAVTLLVALRASGVLSVLALLSVLASTHQARHLSRCSAKEAPIRGAFD